MPFLAKKKNVNFSFQSLTHMHAPIFFKNPKLHLLSLYADIVIEGVDTSSIYNLEIVPMDGK